MADSPMSDADKIRMKRLAKLGGGQSSGTSTPAAATATNGTQTPPQPTSVDAQSSASSSQPTDAPKPTPTTEQRANPFTQLGMKTEPEKATKPQINIRPRPTSPMKRERDGSERPRSRQGQREPESLETWQDRTLRSIFRVTLKPEETKDAHGHHPIYLASARGDMEEQNTPVQLSIDTLEGAITEAASKAPNGKPFEYLLACFKRATRAIRNSKLAQDDPKRENLKEARRLCMSYCIFAVTMPEMFGEHVPAGNPMVDHLLADPECETGLCTDFLEEASLRLDEDESLQEAFMRAAEELSTRLAAQDMLGDYRPYVLAFRNLIRFPKIADVITQSPRWAPADTEPQDIETNTLLGPFFRLSPMQLSVAQSYFSAPKTRDRGFIANAQNAVRMTLRTHQLELFAIANEIIRHGPGPRSRLLDWFAMCVNKNHKKRAMRVDYKTVSSDGFMVNVTTTLDQLCEPFMDASFSKIGKIDADYLRRNPRVDISDETKINSDQHTADAFFANKAGGTSNFISEVFFLTVAAHHYGTEAAQERMSTMRKTVKRMEQEMVRFEADRHKFVNDPRYLAQFEQGVERYRKSIDDTWSTIHATHGVLLDDFNQARSMQFMRYVIVWLLRLASRQDLPQEELRLPLPDEQPDVFKCLPEYFLEDIVDNFKFIVGNIPHIMTPQQCDEIVQICVTFLRNSEYVKNPGVKSGLVTILFYGVQPFGHHSNGLLGDLLVGSPFAHKHLLHALMKYYIEAESTGTHTQFYDKFNIRYEIFQVIKCIWKNTLYRENLAKEARVNTGFFVRFVNMIVNDVTFVLDESLTSFLKIHELTREISSPAFSAFSEDERKQKQEDLDDQKKKAKSYMGLTMESMETLILFTETLPDAFSMPEIVQRLADMLDYNLDIMVGDKRTNLKVENAEEYKFRPRQLLSDIVRVFTNLAEKQNFVAAIARDGRSYKPENFHRAAKILSSSPNATSMKSPEELRVWEMLSIHVAAAKATEMEEEADLGDIPDEFLDPLLADLMIDPVILPTSRTTVDRATIRSHLLSDPNDPFNRAPLKIEDVIPNTELKEKITKWKADKLAAKRAEKAVDAAIVGEAMDLSSA